MANGLSQAEVEAMDVMLARGLKALEIGDIEAWLACWTEDAVVMPPGMPAYRGKDQLKEYWKVIGGYKFELSDVQYDGRDDLAVVTTGVTVPRASGTVNGKQILVLNKVDGQWLLAAVCVNLDVPGELELR